MSTMFANPATLGKLEEIVKHGLHVVLWDENNGNRYEVSNVYVEDNEVNVDLRKVQ